MKKNLILQTIYQFLAVFVPIITTPHLARTLGAEQIGVYSYSYSYIYYFTMLAMLGFSTLGSREIASVQNSPIERNRLFWSIYTTQILSCGFSFILFLAYWSFFLADTLKTVMLFQGIYLLACFFDVNWYYFGMEKFSVTVLRSIVVKIISVLLILTVIQSGADLNRYILIMAGAQLVNNIVIGFFVFKRERFALPQISTIKYYLRESALLCVPVAAMSIYHLMDKTMLGILSDDINSGFYYSVDKVINIPLCAIIGIGTVMLPRVSTLLSDNSENQAQRIFRLSYDGYLLLSCAMAFGIAAIAPEFVPLFFGEGYLPCIMLTTVMAVALPFKGLSDLYRTQYLIPRKKTKIYILSAVCGALVNLSLNMLMIKYMKLGAMGATIATVVTEAIVCLIQGRVVFRNLHMNKMLFRAIPYIAAGAVMYFAVRCVSNVNVGLLAKIAIEIIVGALVYLFQIIAYLRITKHDFLKSVKVG